MIAWLLDHLLGPLIDARIERHRAIDRRLAVR